jgi:hypothetical protein
MSRAGELDPDALPYYLQLVWRLLSEKLRGIDATAESISAALRELNGEFNSILRELHRKYSINDLENAVKNAEKVFNRVNAKLADRIKNNADQRCVDQLSATVTKAQSALDNAIAKLADVKKAHLDVRERLIALQKSRNLTLAERIDALAKNNSG